MEQYRVGPYTAGNWGSVSSIEAVDDYAVRINLTDWDSRLLDTLCYVWVVSPTAFEKNGVEWMRNNPVGTGPFKLVSWQRDTTKVYEKWDGYWQKSRPYLDKIEINIIADSMVQVASFLAGENDILTLLNPTDARTLQNDYPDLVLVTSPVVGFTRSLMFDSANPDSPFSDLLVRQAVSYAIDREAIIDGIYKGFGKLTYQTKSPDMWSYNPNVKGYPYNPDEARELLKEAGYGEGFSTKLYYKSDQIYQDLFVAVQADLAAIDIDIELQPLNPAAYGEMYFAGNWFGGIFGADMQSIPEPLGLRSFFSSVQSMPSFQQCIIHPQEIDDIIEKITVSTDFEAKEALGQELERLICDEYCICPNLGYWPTMIAKYPYVHDDYCGCPRTEPYTFADAWIED
jgi:ABC-type transport system substrate-binding protein